MEREKVIATVEHLFRGRECVPREELLAEIDRSALISSEEKRILKSLPERECYTRDTFAGELEEYGPDAPIGSGGGLGGAG